MIRIFQMVLGWITGGRLSGIGQTLERAYRAKLDAGTDAGRIAADILIKQISERQSLLLAEQRNFLTRMIRPLFAFPFIFYNGKILIWDAALHLGTTDQMSPQMWQVQMLFVTFYFVGRPFEKIIGRK